MGNRLGPNSDRRGVDGVEDGGSGNIAKPMPKVLSALTDAIVSRDPLETWL